MSTYKPPSLYPNKKQRTGPSTEYPPPLSAASTLSSPRMPANAFPSGRMHAKDVSSSRPSSYESSQRPSVQQSQNFALPPCDSVPKTLDGNARSTYPDQRRQPVELPPTPVSFDLPCHAARDSSFQRPRSSHDLLMEQQCGHRPPLHALQRPRDQPSEQMQTRESSYYLDAHSRDSYGSRMEIDHLPRREYDPRRDYEPAQLAPGFIGGYEPARAQLFMPTPFEYHHGKARKRSNLPKQSTEIMKTWFDQVSTHELAIFGRVTDARAASRTSRTHTRARSRRLCFRRYD